MIRTVTSMLALIMSVTGHVAEASDFVSPCPSVFKYEPQGNEVGKWYGVANFTSEFTLYGLWMNIVLDSKADILGNWIGEVTTDDNIDFKIENTKTKLSAQEPLSVRFFVQYKAQNVTPKLKAIRVNGREICNIEIPQVTEGPKPITEQVVYDVWSRDTDKTTVRPTVTSTTTSYKQQTTTQQYWYQQLDKQRTTTKSYWTQTTTPNVYPVKLVDRQTTTVKPQFWTEAKTTESTAQTTSKPQYWQPTTLKPIYWAKGEDKIQTTVKPQVWPYDKAENTQQKAEDKINVTTEKNKVQTWSHSRVTSNQHTKTHDRNKTKGHSHGHSQNSNNWPKNNEVQIVENIQTNTSVYIQTANDSTYYTTDKTVVWPVVKVTENQTLLPVNKIENSSHALDKQKVHIKHWPKIPADNSTIVVPKQTGVDSSSFIWVESQPTYSGAGHYIRTETPAQNSPIYVRPEDKERVSDKRYETAQYSHDTTRYEPDKAQRVSPVNTYQKKDQQYDNEEDHLVVKPIKRTDDNVQKQNWSGERTVDYYGDSPQSFVGHHTKNKMRLEAEDDGYIKYSDDIMKVSGESTNSHFNSYQLTTDAPAALFYKSEDYDIPRKEDKIEYYVGGLPVFYIPNHAPRPKMEMCIAYNTGYIPPNIHFKTPREGVAALAEKRLSVVTDKTPWGRGMSGVNSFGFGGANAHALLKDVARAKVNNGIPSDNLPRLACVSGRTVSAVARILDDLESRTVDVDEIRLLHAIHDDDIAGHDFKGYILLGSTPTKSVQLARQIQYFSGVRRPVWFVYSGMGSQWAGMAKELMRIPVFAAAIEKCHKALEPKGINLTKIVTENDPKIYDNILNSFIGIAAVQIGLTDVLKTIGIEPDYIIGYSVGDFGCAYADGCLTAEEVILSAYNRGLALENKPYFKDSMADISIGYHQDVVRNFKRSRSEKWVCMPLLKVKCQNVDPSANSYTNGVETPELFEETARLIHANAITIEIAPHGLLQAILRRSLKKDVVNVALTQKAHPDNVQVLFTAFGRLYEAGLNPHLANIYPHVPFPVSQGTPMLAHLVEWEHSENWFVASFKDLDKIKIGERTVLMSMNDEFKYMTGYVINGCNLYPVTGYLFLVWETLGMMMGEPYTEVSVVFENVRFQRATNIPKEGNLVFTITIHKKTGNFEILESCASIVTGRIYAKKNVGQDIRALPPLPEASGPGIKHLLTKDFYKELRLRGYQYSGLFRGVIGCNVEGTRGRLSWVNNWVTFMDCMLQLKIIGQDTRGLFVPTRIKKLSIDAPMHCNAISKMNRASHNKSFEVRVYPNLNVIRAGGIEIRGLQTTSIVKRQPPEVPVYEKHSFIPNFGRYKMKIEDVLRTNVQLVFENIQSHIVKSIELVDEEYKKNDLKPILESIGSILADLPFAQADLLMISDEPLKVPSNITVENRKLVRESNTILFIGANLLGRPKVFQKAIGTLCDNAFLMSREMEHPSIKKYSDIDIVTCYDTGSEYLVLLRKRMEAKPAKFVRVSAADDTFSWVDEIKKELKEGQKLVLYAQDGPINGLLGLVNCLRKEPGGEIVYGLFISDPSAPPFNPDLEFYEEQLNKDLIFNVYKDGQWGTYRHLSLDLDTVRADHAYVNALTIGDFSSLKWIEGTINENRVLMDKEKVLVRVYCAALNFRDVMAASSRVTGDAVASGRLAEECVLGTEFVGKTVNGTRVMGMVRNRGIANLVEAEWQSLYPIPDQWTFEEAATVPVAYGTVYYAMIMVGGMQRGESILIHVGSGGVGQAAINVALYYGCEVFTTVGTAEKRAFIKKLFPQLKDSHIGNSRDTSFEDMIRRETNGKGVDMVLNSLSDDKLQASVRCLAFRGRFLDIGKFDISNDTDIAMYFSSKELTFRGITLSHIFNEDVMIRKRLQSLLLSGIQNGAVRSLTYCTFEANEVENAFRYMAAGKHIGKVIIKIREEDRYNHPIRPVSMPIDAIPRYICHEDYVYIVVGGLGGFGLELADWLIMRGGRKILLTSRRGITNGYQSSRLKAWASYGAEVQYSTHDVSTESGCEDMLKKALSMGPVCAIFNLAVVLRDSIFENQSPEAFKTSFASKALTTMNLDKLSRKLCPGLKNFVVFSSMSCGRGNAGQTNYGYSNSVMERICEERKKLGLPALAVQWGAIADVGLVAETQEEDVQLEIGGTLQQRISSCLTSLDKLMKQDAPIVSCIVVAEKKAGSIECANAIDAVAQIMGIKKLKSISQQSTLAEMGMDSMVAVEIKKTLQREFDIFLTVCDIRNLTFSRLAKLTAQRSSASSSSSTSASNHVEGTVGLRMLIRNFGNEETASEPFVFIPSMVRNGIEDEETLDVQEPIMFMVPGLEGFAAPLEPLCRRLKIKACVLRLGVEHTNENIDQMVHRLYQTMITKLAPGAPFWLLGYSYGTLLTLALASRLEKASFMGTVFCLDGAPDFLYALLTMTISFKNDFQLQNNLLCHTVDIVAPNNDVTKGLLEKLNEIESYDERVALTIKTSPVQSKYSDKFIGNMARASFDRLKTILDFDPKAFRKLQSPVILLRPKENPSFVAVEENYGLDKYTENSVTVHFLEGNHVSIIENKDCANIINRVLVENERQDGKTADNVVTSIVENAREVAV